VKKAKKRRGIHAPGKPAAKSPLTPVNDESDRVANDISPLARAPELQSEGAKSESTAVVSVNTNPPETITKSLSLGSDVSIGISAFGNYDVSKFCLNSLLSAAEGDYELILVDDCSPDNGEIKRLFLSVKEKHQNTKVFRFTSNLEYSGSLNCILSHAEGEKIIFVSNDIYVTPHYLSTLINVADSNAQLGIVRGVSNFVDNGKSTHNIGCAADINKAEDIPGFAEKLFQLNGTKYFMEEYLTGDAFLVTRRLIEKIGTIDPLFYGYFADHDLGIRAHWAGFRLGVAQGAFAFHDQDSNINYLDEAQRQKKLQARWIKVYENWARFKLKYGFPVSLLYPGMNAVDWRKLNSRVAQKNEYYVPRGNYSEFLLK
jgi:GT2 family glycosyltransferase